MFFNGELGEFESENFGGDRLLEVCYGGRWSAACFDGSSDDGGFRRNDNTHEPGSPEHQESKAASTSGQTLEDWYEEKDRPLAWAAKEKRSEWREEQA